MKELLAKLLRAFHQPNPQKPVEPWPFPTSKENCGNCICEGCDTKKEPAKKPAKKKVPAKGIVAAKKTAKKKAK